MAFYQWNQNNSGGFFVVDDKLCHRIIIEASTLDEAEQKAFDMGVYYNGCEDGTDCDCCGDRWYDADTVDIPSEYHPCDNVEDYAQKLANYYGWTTPDIRIFYKNGEVEEIFTRTK